VRNILHAVLEFSSEAGERKSRRVYNSFFRGKRGDLSRFLSFICASNKIVHQQTPVKFAGGVFMCLNVVVVGGD